ncbi:MAG: dual specificity protein phosphatase family protein [Pirellulaceae bacterium]
MNATLTRALFVPSLLGEVATFLVTSRNWWDSIDERLILGAMPFKRHAQRLHEMGVRGVINLCVEYRGPISTYEELGITQLHLPTLDYRPPDERDVFRAIDFIEEWGQGDQPVYLHCKAGRGRSATVALCWLVKSHRLSVAEAEERLIQSRPHVNKHLGQREVVMSFVDQIKQPT